MNTNDRPDPCRERLADWIDGQEFHERCMDYRGARPQDAQREFEGLQLAILRIAASGAKPAIQGEPVPGVVLNRQGKASLVGVGEEDLHVQQRGAKRLYASPPHGGAEAQQAAPQAEVTWEARDRAVFLPGCVRDMLANAARVINCYLEPDSPSEHEALMRGLEKAALTAPPLPAQVQPAIDFNARVNAIAARSFTNWPKYRDEVFAFARELIESQVQPAEQVGDEP